jgi:hypothetical protein
MSPGPNGWEDPPEEETEQVWRGDEHPDLSEEDWPEDECGAEYWIYKRIRDEDGEV